MAKDNEFEKSFYAKIKEENGRLEKNESGTVLLIQNAGGEFTPELLIDFPKCDQSKLWMIKQKSRDFIVNYVLTDDHKAKIVELWLGGMTDLNEITRAVFGELNAEGKRRDGRCIEGRAARKFMTDKEFHYNTITIERLPELELTEDQLSFIKANFRKKTVLEISRNLFGEDVVTLSQEYKTIDKKIEELRFKMVESMISDETKDLEDFEDSGKDIESSGGIPVYNPPKTMDQVVSRINKYLYLGWKSESLRKEQELWCQSLKRYMRTFSFVRKINSYQRNENRTIFEDRFIRYCHDKPNLTHEDLDLYILLCAERVNIEDADRRLEETRLSIESERSSNDNGKVSVASTELLSALQRSYNDGCAREEKYLKNLTTLRGERLKEKEINSQISIIHLYKAFQQNKFRDQQARLGQIEHERLVDESKKLGTISDMMAVVRGISVEELLGDDDL